MNSHELNSQSENHPDEQVLELYVLGKLTGEDLHAVKTHIEHCEQCQYRSMDLGEFINTLRDAAASERSEEKYHLQSAKQPVWQSPWIAAAGIAACILMAIPFFKTVPSVSETVELASSRGPAASTSTHVRSGHPLNLKIDLIGISEGRCCLIHVVDIEGRLISEPAAKREANKISATLTPLKAGQYWIRLLSYDKKPLQELGLTAD